ncbi:hypothetical protein [Zobellella denitrificans]|uniref:hypothetical protein n=1 Tax=Zobellella denitrificans TaxID=347534 RepID=UPI001594F9C6|nr:hypothetical protein [Zobellella denitrificans]
MKTIELHGSEAKRIIILTREEALETIEYLIRELAELPPKSEIELITEWDEVE